METALKPPSPITSETTPPAPEELPVTPMPPTPPRKPWYVVAGLCLVLLLVAGYVLRPKPSTPTVITKPTLRPKPTLPRSKAPGVITAAATATALDLRGGALSPAATFTQTDKTIYLVLTLNNPKLGTKFEYIRYLNGKYLDDGTLQITKPNTTNTSFMWSLKTPGARHLTGSYRVKVYTNGVFEKETSYMVR